MKKPETTLREFVRQIPDDTLRFLNMRFAQNMSGDMAEAVDTLSQFRTIDNWLSSASSAQDWYEMVDMIADFIKREVTRRFSDRHSDREVA